MNGPNADALSIRTVKQCFTSHLGQGQGPGAQPRFQSWGPILGLWYYYSSAEKKIDRSTQFGAVCYIITLYSIHRKAM